MFSHCPNVLILVLVGLLANVDYIYNLVLHLQLNSAHTLNLNMMKTKMSVLTRLPAWKPNTFNLLNKWVKCNSLNGLSSLLMLKTSFAR